MNDPFAFVIAIAQLSAAIALFNGVLTVLGQAKVAIAAMESIARQPEASASIQGPMLIGMAMSETSGIYGLLISIILLFANPMVNLYIQHAVR